MHVNKIASALDSPGTAEPRTQPGMEPPLRMWNRELRGARTASDFLLWIAAAQPGTWTTELGQFYSSLLKQGAHGHDQPQTCDMPVISPTLPPSAPIPHACLVGANKWCFSACSRCTEDSSHTLRQGDKWFLI